MFAPRKGTHLIENEIIECDESAGKWVFVVGFREF